MGGEPTPERGLNQGADDAAGDPPLSVGTVIATAPNLAAVLAAGVTPAEAAGWLDQTNLTRLVPQLGAAEAADVARFLAEPRVQRMLDNAWRTPPQGEPLLAEKLLGQLTERVDLVRMIQATPELANSLTARPLTLHHLASYQEAIDVVGSVLDDIATRGATVVAAEPVPKPEPTRLQAWQEEVSASIEVPEDEPASSPASTRPGRTTRPTAPPISTGCTWRRSPRSGNSPRSQDGCPTKASRAAATPGWREELKDRVRAEDKIAGYKRLSADRARRTLPARRSNSGIWTTSTRRWIGFASTRRSPS